MNQSDLTTDVWQGKYQDKCLRSAKKMTTIVSAHVIEVSQ